MKKLKGGKLLNILNIVLPIIIVIGFAILVISTCIYNAKDRVCDLSGAKRDGDLMIFDDVIVKIAPRGDETSTWINSDLIDFTSGDTIYEDSVGTIYEIEITNNSPNVIRDWSLKMQIPEEMCISDAWNGEIELHKNVKSGNEQVQKIRFSQHTQYNVTADHYYTYIGLMFKLIEGDNIVFFPNAELGESEIAGRQSPENSGYVKMGFIVYIPSQNPGYDANFSAGEIHYRLHASVIKNPFFNVLFILMIAWIISFVSVIVVKINIKRYIEQQKRDEKIIEQTMQTIVNFIEAKDPSTMGHSLRVAQYSKMIAEKMGLPESECNQIYWIALMHDCGKIYIPDNILGKPGKLTDEEYETMKKHTVFGGEVLRDFTAIDNIRTGAMFHHERYDGKGYPNGLAGDEIPLIARIIGVSDAFDAMNSRRCYRNSLNGDVIIEELKKNRGTQFDPEIIDHFLALIESGAVTMTEKSKK